MVKIDCSCAVFESTIEYIEGDEKEKGDEHSNRKKNKKQREEKLTI